MFRLNQLKLALCQMNVVPGRPDINRATITKEIESAAKRNCDLIIFPELCIPGYFIGDLFEDDAFIKDVLRVNEQIRVATQIGITAIFGSITTTKNRHGEDGRLIKFNTALIAQNGEWKGSAIKTLQPNYRIFNDDRHFYSTRKIFEEQLQNDAAQTFEIADLFQPLKINTRIGEIKLGLILCEDMWHQDYHFNPTQYLVEHGAELIINISASPWSWQKNRKRHQIIKEIQLLQSKLNKSELNKITSVPFVYVNNTGIQNTGKNIIIFDGSSTIYDDAGEIIFAVDAYQSGSHDCIFQDKNSSLPAKKSDDTKELYLAINTALKGFFNTLPSSRRKVVIGLSGGIDSALSAALLVDVLGKDNVIGINMPSQFNSAETQSLAKSLAENLGIKYEVRAINDIVEAIAKTTSSNANTPGYENIQARVRMEILAARAQDLNAVFSSNWNKVEAAFGYGTLYGDMAGFVAAIGDLVKREVYQLADYLNREVYQREVVPQGCFTIAPTAELKNNQKDPFDYGNLERRGYHDEMVRAFTEFRRNPEWFLENYAQNRLESEMRLNNGRLKEIFPSIDLFIKDLEKHWQLFHGSYFKRIQSAPVPMVSKRAFGTDLRESILAPHLTARYQELKRLLMANSRPQMRIAILGGSFNPAGIHHRRIAEKLTEKFDKVIIVPCGMRVDKPSANTISHNDRKEIVKRGFAGLDRLEIDNYDLDKNTYTPTYLLDKRYREQYPQAQIWHVVGGDIIIGGRNHDSQIHRIWKRGPEIWHELNFCVIVRPGYPIESFDLPPSTELLELDNLYGSGTMIRDRFAEGDPIEDLVTPEVASYIKEHKLYCEN